MNRSDKTALWCFGAADALKELGMIDTDLGDRLALTPKGVAEWDQLDASGFRPTESEMLTFAMERTENRIMSVKFAHLLKSYGNSRQKMVDFVESREASQ